MHDPLIILAPPRSFTSVLCAMIGQHPQMHGLPELNLFVAETMRERDQIIGQLPFLEHGLLRAVAQLFAGTQTVQTVALARRWLQIRTNCSCLSVFRELALKASPQRLADKSITTAISCENMNRARQAFPNTRFLHLLRHPLGQGESLWRNGKGGALAAELLDALDYSTDPPTVDFQYTWYSIHAEIMTFLSGLPNNLYLRLQGEALLSNPDRYLRQLATWLGLRTDEQAIQAMKCPELSPYASLGPANAPLGNDPKFLLSPALRNSSGMRILTLEARLPWRDDAQGFCEEVKTLAREFGYW